MPKSFDELWDGDAAPAAEAAPMPDAPQPQDKPATETDQAPVRSEAKGEQQSRPAPEAQEERQEPGTADAGKPASQDKGSAAGPDTEPNDGRDPAYGRLRKERNDYREQLSVEKVERARAEERYASEERARKAMEAEIKQLRAAAQQQSAVAAPAAQPVVPDYRVDPDGYARFVQHQATQQAVAVARMQLLGKSERDARRVYGDERVNEAAAWFEATIKNTPQHEALLAQPDPWDALVEQHSRMKVQAEIGNDPAAYKARIKAETRAALEAEIRAQFAAQQSAAPDDPPASRPNLPPSLGRAPNAGPRSGPQHTGPTPFSQLWGE